MITSLYAVECPDGELVLDFPDGSPEFYRVRDGGVEFCTCGSDWVALTPQEVEQHCVLETPVARWLGHTADRTTPSNRTMPQVV